MLISIAIWVFNMFINLLSVVAVPNFLIQAVEWILQFLSVPIYVFKTFLGWDWSIAYFSLFITIYVIYFTVKMAQWLIDLQSKFH